MSNQRKIIIGMIAALGATLLWPTTVTQIESLPKAETKYIRRIFEEHTVGQSIKIRFPVQAVEVFMRGETEKNDAELIIENEHAEEIGRLQTAIATQDSWITVPLTRELQPGSHTLTIKTLPETPREEALLLRYQPDSEGYVNGNMIVDGEGSYGDVALRLKSTVPRWKIILINQNTSRQAQKLAALQVISGIIGGVALWQAQRITKKRYQILSLVAVALFAVVITVPILLELEGVFGGDAFNYLTKAQAFIHGKDPFAEDPRKGPLFSALLIPGLFTADPLLFSRSLSIAAAALAAGLLTLIGKRLGLKWGYALAAGLTLAVSQGMVWEATNGLANTLFVAMILAAFYAFLISNKKENHWLVAVFSGLAFLTRFEGIILPMIVLPLMWWQKKISWRRMLALGALTAAIMLIPQTSLIWSKSSGIRTLSDLKADEGLYLAQSHEEIINNIGRFTRSLSEMWLTPKPKENKNVVAGLIAGIIGGGGLLLIQRRWSHVNLAIGLTALGALLIGTVIKSPAIHQALVIGPWILAGIGTVFIWKKHPLIAATMTLFVLAHSTIITLILPKPRYYLPLLPFISLAIVVGAQNLFSGNQKNKLTSLATCLFLGLFISAFWLQDRHELYIRKDHHNEKAEKTAPMIQAVRYLRSQNARVAYNQGAEQALLIYIKPDNFFEFKSKDQENRAQEELTWLKKKEIEYIVERNDGQQWKSVQAHPEAFSQPVTFTTDYGSTQITVYKVTQDQ